VAKITAKSCPKCGAPLALQRGVSDVQCQYCGTIVHVEWGKKAPAEPQPHQMATIYVANPTGVVPVVIVMGVLLPILFSVIAFIVSGVSSVATSAINAAGVQTPSILAKSLPATCGLNQEIAIVGQKFEGPGPLVTGEINCKVKIKDSTLKSDVVILAKNLVEVTVENSTLEGKEAAVKLGMNSKLFAKKKTSLKGEEAAIRAGVNCEVTLDDARVDGGEIGISTDSNMKLFATKSSVSGKDYGIKASGYNVTIEGKELTMRGARAGIEGEGNIKLDLRGGLIEGDEAAVNFKSSNGELKLSRSARVKGREVAVKGESNMTVEMEDATIESADIAIDAKSNHKLSVGPKAKLVGKRIAVKAESNFELDMRQGTIESDSVAICVPFNLEIRARDSTIRAGADAFRFQTKPGELELIGTSVTGQQRFDAKGCGAGR
jgi:LSD1 subclass zinc finger protein